MATFRASAMIASASQYVIFVLGFTKIVVVSRTLTPAEIGVFAMATALVTLAQVFRVFGTWDYIVAVTDLTLEALRACFTILMAMALIMTGLYLGAAHAVAAFFREPELAPMIWLMAISFLILPIGSVSLAIMTRNMRFGALSGIRIAGAAADTVVTLALAWLGFGAISLAWGFVAAGVTTTLLVVLVDPRNILFRPSVSGIGKILRFGTLSSVGAFLTHIGQFAPALVLGHASNAASVGFFTRGQTLITIFRQGIEAATGTVAQSWFAQASRTTPEILAGNYLRLMVYVGGLAWPFYIYLIINAADLIQLVLGPQWTASVPVAKALAVGGMFSIYAFYGSFLLVGRGHVGRQLSFNAVLQTVRFALLIPAATMGIETFAWALTIGNVLSFAIIYYALRIDVGLSLGAYVASLRGAVILAGAIGIVSLAAMETGLTDLVRNASGDIAALALMTALTGVTWLATIAALDHPLWYEAKRAAGLIRGRLSGK